MTRDEGTTGTPSVLGLVDRSLVERLREARAEAICHRERADAMRVIIDDYVEQLARARALAADVLQCARPIDLLPAGALHRLRQFAEGRRL